MSPRTAPPSRRPLLRPRAHRLLRGHPGRGGIRAGSRVTLGVDADRIYPFDAGYGNAEGTCWSVTSGVLWLAGAALPGDRRLLLWIPAAVLDLCAPFAGYWLPRRGHALTTDYDIEGAHFTDRCQGFVIIALGESIVVTGATAANAGLTSTVVLCLGVAFLETAALWWLYFGAVADRSREVMRTCEDPGRLARDAYTYLHAPIVAGIIAAAVGDDLLIAEPGHALHGVGLAMVLGGPVLYLIGESLFRRRIHGAANAKRLAVAAVLVLLAPSAGSSARWA
jgi:low temperature requirement protein LtrA